MISVRLLVVSLTLVLGCASCVVVPFSVRTSTRPSLASEAQKSLIAGVTTMEDVLLRFGEPEDYLEYESPVFRYRWGRRHGLSATLLTPWRDVTRGVATETSSALRIDFDTEGRVRSYAIEDDRTR